MTNKIRTLIYQHLEQSLPSLNPNQQRKMLFLANKSSAGQFTSSLNSCFVQHLKGQSMNSVINLCTACIQWKHSLSYSSVDVLL